MIKNYLPLAIFSLLLSALSLTSSAHAQSSCTNYYLPGISAPSGYGAAYDVVSGTNALLASVDCSGSSPVFTIGRNAPADYIYAKGYVYTTSWQELSLSSPNPSVATVWYPKIATASVPPPSSSWTFVVGYVCSWTGTLWKCGCADSACTTPGWNLQAYEASQSSPPSTWGGTPNANAVVIAPSGLDSNPCTVSAPCASLEKAQSAVRSSSAKIVYLRAGMYPRTQTLTLTSADNGETWQTYPGDPVDSAVIDGGGTVNAITINGGSNITINGVQIQNVDKYGIGIHGGASWGFNDLPSFDVAVSMASSNIITNNVIHDIKNGGGFGNYAGVIAVDDVPHTTITHNVVYNSTMRGITIINEGHFGDTISDANISGNVIYNVNTNNGGVASDNGAIHLQDLTPQTSTNLAVTNNFIKDWTHGTNTYNHAIYLDQGTSNALISGNVIAPPGAANVGTSAFMSGSGKNNTWIGNIADLGSTAAAFILQYVVDNGISNYPTTGNSFTNNVILMNFAGQSHTHAYALADNYQMGGNPNSINISHNVYYNYGGGEVNTSGNLYSDVNPVMVNPQISGWIYSIAAGSPVYNAPVNFPHIVGGWGPPGYTIPQTGTPPSSPH